MAKETEPRKGRTDNRHPGWHSSNNPRYVATGHGRKDQRLARQLRALGRFVEQLKGLDPKNPAHAGKISKVKDQISTLKWKLQIR